MCKLASVTSDGTLVLYLLCHTKIFHSSSSCKQAMNGKAKMIFLKSVFPSLENKFFNVNSLLYHPVLLKIPLRISIQADKSAVIDVCYFYLKFERILLNDSGVIPRYEAIWY